MKEHSPNYQQVEQIMPNHELRKYPYGPFILSIDQFSQQPIVPILHTSLVSYRFDANILLIEQQANLTDSVKRTVSGSDFVICDGSLLSLWARRNNLDKNRDKLELDSCINRMEEIGVDKLFVVGNSDTFEVRDRYQFAIQKAKKRMDIEVISIPAMSNHDDIYKNLYREIKPIAQEVKELKELIRLEKRYDIGQILRSNPALSAADGTILHWLSNTMIHSTTPEDAVHGWKAKAQRKNRKLHRDFSEAQKVILTLPDDQIRELFNDTQKYLNTTASKVKRKVLDRVHGDYGHRWNDAYEIKQKPKRSLEILREKGINIHIEPNDIEQVKKEYTEDAECPVLDKVKNKKIVTINGFPGSKISLSIHDTFDHFLTYDKLERLGILNRYEDFLQSVGNPHNTDMFNREGELIASVSFEWRSAHTPERQFKPIFGLSQIQNIFKKAAINGLSNNQERAVSIIDTLSPEEDESRQLCSIYNGVLVELLEQRRKHGYIKLLDRNYEMIGNLPLLDPEYLALIIEINHMLCDQKMRASEDLFSTEAIIEDYLIALSREETTQDLSIKIDDIRNFDVESSRVSKKRQAWLRRNPYHAATRIDRCND